MLAVLLAAGCLTPLAAQAPDNSARDKSQNEPPPVIRVESNLVLVRVVVRDEHGKQVDGLTEADFKRLDGNQPQVVSHFSIDKVTPGNLRLSQGTASAAVPERYTALFFTITTYSLPIWFLCVRRQSGTSRRL